MPIFSAFFKKMSEYPKSNSTLSSPSSLIGYRVKRYIAEHLYLPITLAELSTVFGKTPNYINRLFREANGITINQYINRERVQLIASLIRYSGVSFKTACENAGITDVTYGYRLFKKHTGVTPKQYLQSNSYD